MKAIFFLALLSLLSIAIFSENILADANRIVLTEVLPDAVGADGGKEYFELFNNQNSNIILNGWYIINSNQNGSSKKINLPQFSINAFQYFVVAEDLSQISVDNSDGISLGSGKLALYNDFGKIELFDSSNTLQSEFSYGDSKEGVSWETDGPLCNNITQSLSNTPGQQNSKYLLECWPADTNEPGSTNIPASYPQQSNPVIESSISSKILITEIYPSPIAPDKEWIEIFNYGSTSINLQDYFIEEKTSSGISNRRSKLKNQIVDPNTHFVLYENEFNISLNNSGDTIYLFDIKGNLIDEFSYSETAKSRSVGRRYSNGEYTSEIKETTTPTPFDFNKIEDIVPKQEESAEVITIRQIQDQKSGAKVLMYVNVNNFIDKSIFLEDDTGTIKAKLSNSIDFELINTKVKLLAKVTASNGIKNILVDVNTIEIVEYLSPVYSDPDLQDLSTTQIGIQIRLKGVVAEVYANRIRLNIDNQLVSIYTNGLITFSNDLKGKKIEALGTLDYYRNAFRLIAIDIISADVLGAEVPVSYTDSRPDTNGSRLTGINSSENSTESYLIIFGYSVITLILLIELVRNRKKILKYFKINIFGYLANIAQVKS